MDDREYSEKYPSQFQNQGLPPVHGSNPPVYGQPQFPQPGQMPPPYDAAGTQQQFGQQGPYVGPAVTTQPQQVVHVVQQNVIFGETPVQLQCRNCGQHVVTDTLRETGMMAFAFAAGLCVFGCWLGCCLIPLCVDSLKDVKHSCPNCRAYLGIYKAKM